jgi:uncharacterized protein CbrC (UPF0167 family)
VSDPRALRFRYHPDPLRTGMVVRQQIACGCCGQARTYAYVGPYSSPDARFENGEPLCPWCIADGSAAREWGASFVEPAYLSPAARAAMGPEALAELEFRTPSYLCLQQERWLDHHGEAAAYLGEVGADTLPELDAGARAAVRIAAGDDPQRSVGAGAGEMDTDTDLVTDTDAVRRLRADGDGPTAYLFQCLRCGRYEAFIATG